MFLMNIKSFFFLTIFSIFFSSQVSSAEVIMPSSLTANTSSFVLLSDSGTTPSISGYSGTLLVSAVASAGNIKITTTSNILQASGYCGYTSDGSSSPADCSGSSLTEIGFRGTQANINAALATLSFKGDGSTGSPTITVSVTAAGNNYNSANGHYYKIVNDDEISFADAITTAEGSTYNGLSGYLVSITSEAENDFLNAKVNQNAWIGGSDKASLTSNSHSVTEGTWEWISGPDNGKTFFCQVAISGKANAADNACSVATGYSYNNWKSAEPNDHNSNTTGEEDCAHMRSDGEWNDFPCASTSVDYYSIEYGGTAGETATVSGLTTLSINSTEASGSTFNVFDDKQLTGVIDAQSESAKKFMLNSTNTLLNRMEVFRNTNEHKSTNFKDLNLDFDITDKQSSPYAKFLDLYLIKNDSNLKTKLSEKNIDKFVTDLPLSQYLKNEFGLVPKKWKIWSSGSITKGRTKFSIDKLSKISSSNGLTIGIDKVIKKNTLFGIAIRQEKEGTKISNLGTKVKSKAENISIYSSWRSNRSIYIDSLFGLGLIDNHITRITDSSNLSSKVTGKRSVDQIYGAVKINFSKMYRNIKVTNYSKINFAHNTFNEFSEGGNNQALHFNKHKLINQSISLGSVIYYNLNFNGNLFSTLLDFEFIEDLTQKKNIDAYFTSNTNKTYTYHSDSPYFSSLKIKTGFTLETLNNWIYSLNVIRTQKSNESFENSIDLLISKSF